MIANMTIWLFHKKGKNMTKKLKISVSYDDLSEDIKAEIENLRSQGYIVEIEWPGAKQFKPEYPSPYDWKVTPITCSSKSNKSNTRLDDSVFQLYSDLASCLAKC